MEIRICVQKSVQLARIEEITIKQNHVGNSTAIVTGWLVGGLAATASDFVLDSVHNESHSRGFRFMEEFRKIWNRILG